MFLIAAQCQSLLNELNFPLPVAPQNGVVYSGRQCEWQLGFLPYEQIFDFKCIFVKAHQQWLNAELLLDAESSSSCIITKLRS